MPQISTLSETQNRHGKIDTTIVIADEIIISKIYFIRGQKVMLDSDLAAMYQVETKRLKEQVKRNISRFPAKYMFELTPKQTLKKQSLRCKCLLGFHTFCHDQKS